MKGNKVNLGAVIAAVGTGASFGFGLEAVSKKVDFVNQNFLVTKSLSAGLIGSSLVYFGKNEQTKASGYALLGIAGNAASAKLGTLIVQTTGDDPVNGLTRSGHEMIKRLVSRSAHPSMKKKFDLTNPMDHSRSNASPQIPGRICSPVICIQIQSTNLLNSIKSITT
jgi:hypothetical protein